MGTPTGGQWAPSRHSEADIDLTPHPKRRAAMATVAAVPLALSVPAAGAQSPPAPSQPTQSPLTSSQSAKSLPSWYPDIFQVQTMRGAAATLLWISPPKVFGTVTYRVKMAPTWQTVPKSRGGVVVVNDKHPIMAFETTLTGLRHGRTYTVELVGYKDGTPFGALGPVPVSPNPVANSPWPVFTCPTTSPRTGPHPAGAPSGLSCTGRTFLAAVDRAREREGLGPMVLPGNYAHLSAQDKIFVVTNLERGSRGLPTFGLSATLNKYAREGARTNSDPIDQTNVGGWSSNWANTSNALEADFLWMYFDGPGGANLYCSKNDMTGCWGHRQDILGDYGPHPEMGAAISGTSSAAELFASGPG